MVTVEREYPIDLDSHSAVKRQMFVAWQNPEDRALHLIGLLVNVESKFCFRYFNSVKAITGFRPLFGFEDLEEVYEATELFPIFSSRVISSTREDYREYVERLELDVDTATPWELLTKTEGRVQGDTLQLIPVPKVHDGLLAMDLLVAGVRHMVTNDLKISGRSLSSPPDMEALERELESLKPGEQLEIVHEDGNQASEYAQLVVKNKEIPIGYLPNWITSVFDNEITSGLANLIVKRVRPLSAGWHMRVLVTFSLPDRDREWVERIEG